MDDALVTPGSEISPDTHVGADLGQRPLHGRGRTPRAPRAAARPEALVEGNRVARGDELEQH